MKGNYLVRLRKSLQRAYTDRKWAFWSLPILLLLSVGLFSCLGKIRFYVEQPPTLEERIKHQIGIYAEELKYPTFNYVTTFQDTPDIANTILLTNGKAKFFLFVFDEGIILSYSLRIQDAIIAHEMGHTDPNCWELARFHYILGESCADQIAVDLVGYEAVMEALESFGSEASKVRIKLLKEE